MGRPPLRRWLPVTACVACAVLFGTSATASTVSPGLKVSTLFPPPGTRLTVTGAHFTAKQTVHILLGTTSLGSATTSTTGTFTATVTIPRTEPPGNQTLYANQSPSGLTAHKVIDIRTNWAQEGFGPGHWNDNLYENVLTTTNAPNLTQAWASTGASGSTPTQGEPIDENGDVIGECLAASGLCAYSAHTGARLWSLSNHLGTVPFPPLAATAGLVIGSTGYCYTSSGSCQHLTAVSATTGKIVWTQTVPSSGEEAPLLVGSTIYFASDTSLQARALSTGKLLWSIAGTCNSPPTYYNGALYLGDDSGLWAVSTATHKQLWWKQTPIQVDMAPVAAAGIVYGEDDSGFVNPGFGAFNASTGAVIWQNTSISPAGGASYGNDGLIYVDTTDGVDALSTSTGALQWTAFTGNWFGGDAPPTVANGVLYASATSANNGTTGLYAADAETGATLWSNTLGGVPPIGAPTVVNGWVYVTDHNDSIHAFDQ